MCQLYSLYSFGVVKTQKRTTAAAVMEEMKNRLAIMVFVLVFVFVFVLDSEPDRLGLLNV